MSSLRRASRGQFGNLVIWAVIIAFGLGVFILFTPNLTSSFNQTEAANQDDPVLLVNGEEITRGEFTQAYNTLIQNYTRFYQQFGQNFNSRLLGADGAHYQLELRSQVVDQLVRDRLLKQEIAKRNINVPNDEIETTFQVRMEEILSQSNLTEQQADDILRQQGSSLSQFKNQLRQQVADQLKQDKLKEVVVGTLEPTSEDLVAFVEENDANYRDKLAAEVEDPSEEAIAAYYEEHQSDYLKVHARHILIKVDEDAPEADVEAARAKIEDLKRQLDEGADFEALAKENSEDVTNASKGGDLGTFGPGRMVKPFEEAAFALEVGQISDPVRTKFGFHLIKLEEKQAQDLDSVKDQIRSKLQDEQKQNAFDAFMASVKAGDEEAVAKLTDTVKDDYVSQTSNKQFEDWVTEITDAAEITIDLPEVVAFRMEADDVDGALAAYEQIKQDGTSSDRYLDYYIGRLYQKKHTEESQRLEDLQAKEELTEEEKSEIEQLTAQVENDRQQAIHYLMATAEKGDGTQALYEDIINLGEDNASLRYQYAVNLLQSDNRSGAIAQLQHALELDENHVDSLQLYGDLMMENFNYNEAAGYFERAVAASGQDAFALKTLRLKLAAAYLGGDRLDEAKELFEVVLANDDDNTTALTGLGDLYFKQEDYQNALEYYQKSLNVSPSAQVRVKVGNAHLALGQLDDAKTAFEQAQKSSPYAVGPYLGLGKIFEAQGSTEKALEQYQEGFLRARDYEERRDLGEKILALDPQDLDTRFKLADLYKDQHVFQRAIDQYTEILNQDPNSVAAYWGLAESYEGRIEYDTAKTYYQSALTIPDLSEDDRIKTLEKIVSVEKNIVGFQNTPGPDGLDALISLANIYLDQGDSDKVDSYLEELEGYNSEYRAQDVAELRTRLDELAANKPGQAVEDQGRTHVEVGTNVEDYNSTPPTSGDHYPTWADWGIYTTPIRNELQVHNLEHGGVIVQYKPDVDEAVVDQLVDVVRELGPTYKKLILAPYPDLDTNLALTAWGRIDTFDEFDAERIRQFVAEYIDQGPEQVNYDGTEWWTQDPHAQADAQDDNTMDNNDAQDPGDGE